MHGRLNLHCMNDSDAPMLDLPTRWLDTVCRLLAQHVPEAEVWAYGSRVTGGAHAGSDLDLVLRCPGDLDKPHPGLLKLKEAFSESNLPILVDVLDWANIPETFRAEIEAAHELVKPSPQARTSR